MKHTQNGTGPGTEIVWLHGAGLNTDLWSRDRASGTMLHLPGHGDAPRTAVPTVAAYADAVIAQCPDRFDLVGHSLGGMVAQTIAARWPDRIRRLVLVETWPGMTGKVLHQAGGAASKALASLLGPQGVGALSASYQRGVGKDLVRASISAMDPDALEDAMRAAMSFDGWPDLPRITAPTLVLRGRKNAMTYKLCEMMAKRIPNATYQELDGGHLLPSDCPEAFYDAVDAFLRGTTPDAPAHSRTNVRPTL